MSKPKVLCLHGYGTNKDFMKKQMKLFRRAYDKYLDFVFVDGPFVVNSSFVNDPKVLQMIEGDCRSWYSPKTAHKFIDQAEYLESLEKVREAVERENVKFDGVLGFSQGSALFQLLLEHQHTGLINWPWLNDIKFYLNFSAESFRVKAKNMEYHRFQIPSLHFLSEQDFLFSKCIFAPTLFKDPTIIMHTFGHKFPALGEAEHSIVLRFLKNYALPSKGSKSILANSKL